VTIARVFFAGVWAAFIVWVFFKFWLAKRNDPDHSRVGGRFLGTLLTLCAALYIPSQLSFPGLTYWVTAAYITFIAFPICTICSYYAERFAEMIIERRSRK
jgi:hypothetical protein